MEDSGENKIGGLLSLNAECWEMRRAIDGPVMTVARTKAMSPRKMVLLERWVKRVEPEPGLGDDLEERHRDL